MFNILICKGLTYEKKINVNRGGGLVFASSFPMIAASCDGKTKVAEKENKEPVKKEDSKKATKKEIKDPVEKENSKKVAEQPKLETTENNKIDKENKADSIPAETTRNSESTASTNSMTKRTDTTETDL